MSREQRFGFSFEVSRQFLTADPDLANRWVEARQVEIAKQEYATGPRGGTYRLVTPPDEWRWSDDPGWLRNVTTFHTRRYGRYIRPGRVHLRSEPITFDTFDLLVKDGQAMLPDGRVIKTESRTIVVPVPPSFDG